MQDVIVSHKPNHGEVSLCENDLAVGDARSSTVYLSLFGGMHEDGGIGDEDEQWWGNYGETAPRKLRGVAHRLIDGGIQTRQDAVAIERACLGDIEHVDGDDKEVIVDLGAKSISISIDSNVEARI